MDVYYTPEGLQVEEEDVGTSRNMVPYSHWGDGVIPEARRAPCSAKAERTRVSVSFAVKKRRPSFSKLLLKSTLVILAFLATLALATTLRRRPRRHVKHSENYRLWDNEYIFRVSELRDRKGIGRYPHPWISGDMPSRETSPSQSQISKQPCKSTVGDLQTQYHKSGESEPTVYRFPRLVTLDALKGFSVGRAFSRVVSPAEVVSTLTTLHYFFKQESLSLIEGNKFVETTEALVAHVASHEREKLDKMTVIQAFRVLERRFVILRTLTFALELLGEPIGGAWWGHLTTLMPHEYSVPPLEKGEGQKDAFIHNLVARLSTAVSDLKAGVVTDDQELRKDVSMYIKSLEWDRLRRANEHEVQASRRRRKENEDLSKQTP